MASPLEIMTNALRDIGALGAGTLAPGGEDLTLALSHYNRLISRWSAQGRMSYYERTQAFTFTTSKQSYSLGPTGSGADFIFAGGVRPPVISRAKLVVTASSPASEIDLPVIYKAQYEDVDIPAQSGTQPYCVYYQATFPTGTLWPVPYPTNTANQLRLFWPAQLAIIDIADIATDIPMPPALEDALTFTLSERLCIPFGKTRSDDLKEQAHGARQVYAQINEADPAFIGTALLGENEAYGNQWFLSRGH